MLIGQYALIGMLIIGGWSLPQRRNSLVALRWRAKLKLRTVSRALFVGIISTRRFGLRVWERSLRYFLSPLTTTTDTLYASRKTMLSVGHVPREQAKTMWHFLMHGGQVSCEVTGRRKLPFLLPRIFCSSFTQRRMVLVFSENSLDVLYKLLEW